MTYTDAMALPRLLEACALGDRAAFRELYTLSARYVFGIALGILKDKDIASDVAQETFVRIWKRAGHFTKKSGNALRPEPESIPRYSATSKPAERSSASQ